MLGLVFVGFRVDLCNLGGALIIRRVVGGMLSITIRRNPQNSIGNDLGPCSRTSSGAQASELQDMHSERRTRSTS